MLTDQIRVVLLIGFLNAGCLAEEVGAPDLTCYRCDTQVSSGVPHDTECGMDGYDGHTATGPYHACYTEVFDSGRVIRGRSGHHEDMACHEFQDHMYCTCEGNKCNNELCQHCFPSTSPHTKTTTTTTPSSPTEEPRFSCYSCTNDPDSHYPKYDPTCANYDYAKNTEPCDGCSACYTHTYTDGRVSRGPTTEVGMDDCEVTSFHKFCYCHESKCNADRCDECNDE